MNVECAVCFGDFHENRTAIFSPPCGHIFHSQCVTAWIAKRKTCPQCRQPTTQTQLRRIYLNTLSEEGLITNLRAVIHDLSSKKASLKIERKKHLEQISILENELKTNTASEQEAKVKLCREHATAIERMYNECETEKGKVYNETRAEKAKMRCDFMIEKGKLIEEFMAEKEKMLKEFQAEKVQMLKKSMHVDREIAEIASGSAASNATSCGTQSSLAKIVDLIDSDDSVDCSSRTPSPVAKKPMLRQRPAATAAILNIRKWINATLPEDSEELTATERARLAVRNINHLSGSGTKRTKNAAVRKPLANSTNIQMK